MKKILLFSLIIISSSIFAQDAWKTMTSVEDICNSYPELITEMFDDYNLDYPGLEKVKQSVLEKDNVNACKYLLEYYSKSNAKAAVELRKEQPKESAKTEAIADTILTNVFEVQCVRGEVPYLENGHRNWDYSGPNKDFEWAWLSNRHAQIESVLETYFKTGNTKYIEYIDLFLKDFITASLPYPGVKSRTAVWRGLEVSFRVKVWSKIFYSLIDNPNFSDASRLLILSSLPDHGHYNRQFHASNNWLTMEISALAAVSSNFPEYKMSDEWLDYAIKVMTESMKGQVYPDGVQTELTSHYHHVALSNFMQFKHSCDNVNKDVPEFFTKTIEDMTSYLAHIIRPDGYSVLNNDGDLNDISDYILSASKEFNRTDWEYIASNGKSGVEPSKGPSFLYPYAGHVISRSGYDKNAQWSFFDIGPCGTAHVHNDKLHINIFAYGQDLLVDGGRYAYTGDVARKYRGYAIGTASHNSILINGRGQNSGIDILDEPITESNCIITPEYDYATGTTPTFIGLDKNIKHTRAMMYVRDEFWVIVDRIETNKPQTISALWHWHPTCIVNVDGNTIKTDNKKGNLAIIPITNQDFDIELIKGQENPIQGWYCSEYNDFEPNITSVYNAEIKNNNTIVWLLVPSKGEMKKISAKVISENSNEVTISIKEKKKSWNMVIPYFNSANLKFEIN